MPLRVVERLPAEPREVELGKTEVTFKVVLRDSSAPPGGVNKHTVVLRLAQSNELAFAPGQPLQKTKEFERSVGREEREVSVNAIIHGNPAQLLGFVVFLDVPDDPDSVTWQMALV